MKTSIVGVLIGRRRGDESFRPALLTSCPTAFTLVELLVVIATMAVLAVMLLPALAGTQAQSKVTACTARFRQWAVSANLYANDNRGSLPAFAPYGGGKLAWDVGKNICNALYPYGMDVPDYFCPMRPAELGAANSFMAKNPQPQTGDSSLKNALDLTYFFSRNFGGECVLNDNYWVPRATDTSGGGVFPVDYSSKNPVTWPVWLKNSMPSSAIYGFPQRLHDVAVPYVPFVSDSAGSGQGNGLNSTIVGPNVTNIAPSTAHFVNNTLLGVNCAYADGHVAAHNPNQIKCSYYNGFSYWFY
jgi:prepilin-type processing-associated H-X9-DG protein